MKQLKPDEVIIYKKGIYYKFIVKQLHKKFKDERIQTYHFLSRISSIRPQWLFAVV